MGRRKEAPVDPWTRDSALYQRSRARHVSHGRGHVSEEMGVRGVVVLLKRISPERQAILAERIKVGVIEKVVPTVVDEQSGKQRVTVSYKYLIGLSSEIRYLITHHHFFGKSLEVMADEQGIPLETLQEKYNYAILRVGLKTQDLTLDDIRANQPA